MKIWNMEIKPVEFVCPLSEVEVRMTLKELCGSRLYDYPFRGEVDKKSFWLVKNNSMFTKTLIDTDIRGEFFEQDGKTRITITLTPEKTPIWDIISVLVILSSIIYPIEVLFEHGSFGAVIEALAASCLAVFAVLFPKFYIYLNFKRSVDIIKKALDNASSR